MCEEIEDMFGNATRIILAVLFLGFSTPALADNVAWQYRVVILKGITGGGTIEKQSNGIYLDTKKTEALNRLAEDGWEVVAVAGAPGADDTVYLRRQRRR
jgi:hypothetical protein